MKRSQALPPFRKIVFVAASLLTATAFSSVAQTIQNPSFELDAPDGDHGYLPALSSITGWTATVDHSAGLNPAIQSRFADNGAIPDGNQVAYIQYAGAPQPALKTSITGLTEGVKYTVNFRFNARTEGGTSHPLAAISTDGIGETVALRAAPVSSQIDDTPYRYGAYNFTARATSAAAAGTQTLTFTNISRNGDTSILLDALSIAPATGGWSFAPWTDDASSGIDSSYVYTHAYTFGTSAAGATVNGVAFTPLPFENPSAAGLTTSGFPNLYAEVNRTLAGDSSEIGKSFMYGDKTPMTFTLTGLKPNTSYVATIFGVGFDGGDARAATFSSSLNPADRLLVDLDQYGITNGIRVSYAYTTGATGEVTLTYASAGNNSFHTSAFTNHESIPLSGIAPSFVKQPQGGVGKVGGSFTFTPGVTGSAPLTYQWKFKNADIPNETSQVLTLQNLTTANTGEYQLTVKNDISTVVSDSVTLTVLNGVPGLYDSGVANDGTVLAGGEADPHYILIANADGDPLIQAVVLDSIPGSYFSNSATSKWIGPRTVTSSAASGDYVYRLSFDLTGFDLSTVVINGKWASDNSSSVSLNGTQIASTPHAESFSGLLPFVLNSAIATFAAGVNTLDFTVNNAGQGSTGLRVSGLEGFGLKTGGGNTLPVAAADGFAISKDTSLSIPAAVLLANDSDPDQNPLSITAVSAASTGGGSVTLAAGTVTYQPDDGYTGTDSFTYTLSDGAGGTATGTVQVAVVEGEVPALERAILSSSATSQRVRFLGIPGTRYHFQRSADLNAWTDVQVTVAPVTGLIEFVDASPRPPRHFYRVAK